MKSVWLTIAMVVLLVGLGAYVYFVELPSERTQTAAETQDKKLIPFEEQDITGLIVRTEVGEVVLAPDEKRAWKITAPMVADADSREVESLLRALVLGRISRVVEEQTAALGPFGLEKPATVLTLTAGSRQETLSVGDSGPISSTLYAMRASDKKVLLTSLAPKDVLNKTLLTLRKKEVLRMDQTKVDRLRLAYPANEMVLYRVRQADLPGPAAGNDKKSWKLRYPLEADADQAEVNSLLIKLENLKALGFVDPGPQHDALLRKLTKPDVKITVHADGTDQIVKLYQLDLTTGEAYAVTAQEAPLYRISPLAIKDLTKELFTLQDKRLLGVNMDDLAMLAVKTRDQRYTLINQNGDWVLEDQPAEKLEQEAADLFISRVVNLPAEIRVVKQAGPLAPYGLATPTAEFTATAKDGKQRGRLVLGTSSGGLVYAMGHLGLPGIFQARADLLSQIPAKADLKAKTRQVSGLPPEPGRK
ncbi:MAG: DUF4340 domain-containing protein [Nitrospirae bacterium]|nr:MAG: DUF4340 domain-containing protein [Nitrospirota bacterium]